MNQTIDPIIINGNSIFTNRPEPITEEFEVVDINKKSKLNIAVKALIDGYSLIISDYYSTGLDVLNELKKATFPKNKKSSYQGERISREKFRELSNRIFLEVNNHKLRVSKAPKIGWLKILYSELDYFLLPLPQVQGLNSSWQWYTNGIEIPTLEKKVYPYYGTYFPTRFEHLSLFDHWLQHYKGEKENAYDIGIGSGILSFQMLKHGFNKIYGTDINPNAIIGVNSHFTNKGLDNPIELTKGNLFADYTEKSELIVFNPPWIPIEETREGIDSAIYYSGELFENFFTEAKKHLKEDGKLVMIFSNLAQLTNATSEHPIEKELEMGKRFQKEYLVKKKVGIASTKTKRSQKWRGDEMVELWVLKHI